MTPIAKGISAGLIIVGIIFQKESIRSKLVGQAQEELIPWNQEGEDPRVVSKTGAYQNTKFKHFTDYKFAASLGKSSLKKRRLPKKIKGLKRGKYIQIFI